MRGTPYRQTFHDVDLSPVEGEAAVLDWGEREALRRYRARDPEPFDMNVVGEAYSELTALEQVALRLKFELSRSWSYTDLDAGFERGERLKAKHEQRAIKRLRRILEER